MLKIAAPITQEWVAAAERAYRMRQRGAQAVRIGEGVYQVRSASRRDTVYTVRIRHLLRLDAACDCPHGRHPRAKGHCWHVAAALCAETRRAARPTPGREEMARRMARFAA